MAMLLQIIGMLSFLAFIVGMFRPKTVRCSSRGMVALIYLGILIVCASIADELDPVLFNNKTKTEIPIIPKDDYEKTQMAESAKKETKELPVLEIGSAYKLTFAGGTVQITFTNIKVQRTPKNTLNLVFTLFVENASGKAFSSFDAKWKLLDSKGVELDDTEVYDPSLCFEYNLSMIHVDPYSEEQEQMGYNVKEGATYYLSLGGEIIGEVPVDIYMNDSLDEVDF